MSSQMQYKEKVVDVPGVTGTAEALRSRLQFLKQSR